MNIIETLYDKLFVRNKSEKKDFSEMEHVPQMGDCILIEKDGFIADGIEWFSGGIVSHTAIYIGSGYQKIIEATEKGVIVDKLNKYFKNDVTIHLRRIKDITVNEAEEMKEYAFSRVNNKYDFLKFVTLAWYFICKKLGWEHEGNVADDKNKDICSELYYDSAEKAGIKLVSRKGRGVITPQDLLECKKMDTIIVI